MKYEVRYNWDMGMGHVWLNVWGIYGLNGWGSVVKQASRLKVILCTYF